MLGDDLPLIDDAVTVEQLLAHRSGIGDGFWIHRSRDTTILVGMDAGVSFQSMHDPTSGLTHTVIISNTSAGAWPIARCFRERLTP